MKSYHKKRLKKSVKQLIRDVIIASIGGVAIVSMIIGASIQHQDRINEIASSQGHESRQRLLFAIVRLIFFWKEKRLPVTALEDEVPGLLEWAETNNLSSPVCIS